MDARDILIRTVIGEAANEGEEGWAAVAHTILNRARDPRWPGSPDAVALQPKQFSAWNDGAGGNDLVRKYGPGDPIYERVGAVVDQVAAGAMPDPTGGATHYYSPAGMTALVEQGAQSNLVPSWWDEEVARRGGQPTRIGGHLFAGMAEGSDGGGVEYAQARHDAPPERTQPRSEDDDAAEIANVYTSSRKNLGFPAPKRKKPERDELQEALEAFYLSRRRAVEKRKGNLGFG